MSSKKNNSYYTIRNKVKLIRGGSEYFNLLLQLIHSATHSIHLQFYIYDDDTGLLIGEVLMDAAQRNVKVYFMASGVFNYDAAIKSISGMLCANAPHTIAFLPKPFSKKASPMQAPNTMRVSESRILIYLFLDPGRIILFVPS